MQGRWGLHVLHQLATGLRRHPRLLSPSKGFLGAASIGLQKSGSGECGREKTKEFGSMAKLARKQTCNTVKHL